MSAPSKLQVNWEAHLEALPLPTWITQTQEGDGGVLECGPIFLNRACRDALGLTRELVEYGLWARYIHPEDRQACLVAWTDFLEGRAARFQQTLRWIRPDTKETVSWEQPQLDAA